MKFKRSCGILAHPTSFPGKYGIGDLGDEAIRFIDFLRNAGQKLWQILPLGPTSFGDSPYQSFSSFAGNPLLISPDKLISEGYLHCDELSTPPQSDPFTADYGSVIEYKYGLYRKAFEKFKYNGKDVQTKAFETFCSENKLWLDDYVLFTSLKKHFIEHRRYEVDSPEYLEYRDFNLSRGYLTDNQVNDYFYGAVWNSWPDDIKTRKKSALLYWTNKLADEIEFQKFLQYEFFRQWFDLKKYANSLEINIIGDLPIFVAFDSTDVWASPELFFIDENYSPTVVAGVPPDYFSATGQLWGNPIYRWERHKADGYKWWTNRIAATLNLVDIVRLDHFRGFEAYWEVPYGNETAENGKWRDGPGEELFRAVEKSIGDLPIIAEDLGLITEAVDELRDNLKLPGMKVLQFAFESDPDDKALPHNFETSQLVVYTGTHDNDTTAGWYENAKPGAKDYLRRYLNVSGENVSWDLIRVACASCASVAIFPIQDIMSLPSWCRMNTPGTTSGNWQFRYTENMLTDDLANHLKYLCSLFNR